MLSCFIIIRLNHWITVSPHQVIQSSSLIISVSAVSSMLLYTGLFMQIFDNYDFFFNCCVFKYLNTGQGG